MTLWNRDNHGLITLMRQMARMIDGIVMDIFLHFCTIKYNKDSEEAAKSTRKVRGDKARARALYDTCTWYLSFTPSFHFFLSSFRLHGRLGSGGKKSERERRKCMSICTVTV